MTITQTRSWCWLLLAALSIATPSCSRDVAQAKAKPPKVTPTSAPADRRAAFPVAAPIEVDWKQPIADGKYETYRALLKTLNKGTTPASSIDAFAFLVSEPSRLERIRQWTTKLQGPERGRALRILFAELMLADSDPDVLYGAARDDIERTFSKAEGNNRNYGMYFSWGLSRPSMACIIGYEATGQVRFLELLADTFERILPLRDIELGRVDEVRGKTMHNWGTDKYAKTGQYSAGVTTAGRATYPITRLVQIVRTHPELQEKFGERADRYLQAVREIVDEYDPDYRTIPGTAQGHYIGPPTQLTEPLNHMASMGNCLLTLSQLTGEQKYRTMAEGIANYYKASTWVDENGCLVWQYQPQPDDRHTLVPEHVWKSRVTFGLMINFAQQDVVFNQDDMQRIAKTFLTNIHRSHGQWNALIISKFKDFGDSTNGGGLLCVTPYILLEPYEPRVREAIEEMVATRPDAGGWLNHSHGIEAYAFRLKNPGFNVNRTAESLEFPEVTSTKKTPSTSPDEDDDE